MAEGKQRTVKLHCPSLAKTIHFVLSWDNQKLDLGCIARAFGLDPSTLKINGHFISRGVDFVSSSVTWRSLLSFFSSKGLSTGKDDKDAILVDGKMSKVGTKRGHVCEDDESGIFQGKEHVGVWDNRELRHSEKFLVGNKKLKQSNSGNNCQREQMSKLNSNGLKRRQLPPSEDFGLLKKLKITDKSPEKRKIPFRQHFEDPVYMQLSGK